MVAIGSTVTIFATHRNGASMSSQVLVGDALATLKLRGRPVFLERDLLLCRRIRGRELQPHDFSQLVRLQLAGDGARLPRRRVFEHNEGH